VFTRYDANPSLTGIRPVSSKEFQTAHGGDADR